MSSSTSTSSHLNINMIININIVSYQYYHQHHKQLYSTYIDTKFMLGIHISHVFKQCTPHRENSKLKKRTMIFKTNSYAHLKFNKEVNRIKIQNFWVESPLQLRLFPKNSIITTTTSFTNSIINNKYITSH